MQVATQLISAAMVIYALKNAGRTSTSALLLRPWFIVLVIAGAIERLAGLALGVSMERDWVVLVWLLIRILFCRFFPIFFNEMHSTPKIASVSDLATENLSL
jgi:hypothetical protein